MARHKRRYRVGDILEVLTPFHVYVADHNIKWNHLSQMSVVVVSPPDKLLVTKIHEQRVFLEVSRWGQTLILVFAHAERPIDGLPRHQSVRKRFDAKSNSEAGPALAQP